MRIRSIRALHGPNVFHHRPVLVLALAVEGLAEAHSASLPGFTDRLLELLPGLHAHACSRGHAGGFVARLRDGTWPGHVIEHVALELSEAAGIGVTFGRTVAAQDPDTYEVAVRFRSEAGMRRLLLAATELFERLVRGEGGPALAAWLAAEVEAARRLADDEALGPTTRSLVDAAARRGIPWTRVGEQSLIQLGWGDQQRWLQASTTHLTRLIPADIAGDKDLTKALLRRANIPVPRGLVVTTAGAARAALADLGGPVVVKPLDGHQGDGVSLALTAPDEVAAAFERARRHSRSVVVEEHVAGRDLRVLVVDGRIVAASERLPAHVTGDGARTIAQLVARENEDPRRAEGHRGALTRLPLEDEVTARCLARQGLGPASVPAAGQVVLLRETGNLSTGGTARDVTDLLHEDLRVLCLRAARVVGLDVAGIDLVVPDPTAPIGPGRVLEVNAAPGLRMHHAPSEGAPRDAAGAIIDMLFPGGADGRIPVVAVTGTNGKTTVARLLARVLAATGRVVGVTTTTDVRIGDEVVDRGDCSGPTSARAVLSDPAVQVAVLETARGGILRGGLAYDWSDVGVITNVQLDHIGQAGVRSLQDLVHIKSLVAERVRPGGTIVLDAEDPSLAALMREERLRSVPERRVAYFALDPGLPLLRDHLRAGGTAYVLQDGWLVVAAGARAERLVAASDLPLTHGGTARFQVKNALATLAAARALGVRVDGVLDALRAFEPHRDNPGRGEVLRVGEATVVLDYGHNPGAFQAVGAMIERWSPTRRTCVVTCPGDRADSLIEEGGRAVARAFDRVFLREDADRRGRAPGEVAALLRAAIADESPEVECEVVLDEAEAVERALRHVVPGEVVVVFHDDLSRVDQVLAAHGAAPAPAEEARVGP